MKGKILRAITAGILSTALAAGFTACGNEVSPNVPEQSESNSEGAENQTPNYEGVTIYISDASDQGAYGLAAELGFWEDEFAADGITVEPVELLGGGPAFLDAAETGSVHFGILGDQPLISGYASGRGVEIIGTSSEDTQSYRIIVGNDSGITAVSDLKGKKVAVQAGTNREKVFKKIMLAEGFSDDDVEVVNLGSADGIAALTAGSVDAVVLYMDFVDDSVGTVIADYTEYGRSVRVIGASTKFTDEYPELTARVLKVFNRTVEWENENREEAIRIIAERGEFTEQQAIEVYERETRRIQFTDDDAEVLDSTAEFIYENGTIDHLVTSEDFVDTQYLELAGLLD